MRSCLLFVTETILNCDFHLIRFFSSTTSRVHSTGRALVSPVPHSATETNNGDVSLQKLLQLMWCTADSFSNVLLHYFDISDLKINPSHPPINCSIWFFINSLFTISKKVQGTSSPLLELLLYTSCLYFFLNQDQNNKTSNFVICLQSSRIKEIHFKIKFKKSLKVKYTLLDSWWCCLWVTCSDVQFSYSETKGSERGWKIFVRLKKTKKTFFLTFISLL